LTREILAPAAVVVLGAIMTILDATIVNVALPTLGQDLHTSISTIQWVPTIYLLAFASVLIGAGMGATITPAMAAAYQGLPPAAIGQATSTISVVQRVAGALGSALLAVVLQQATTARLPGFRGGIGQAGQLAASSPHAAAALAQAFGVSFAVALAISVLALIPTALLPRREA
jgi:MFS family permease